MSFYQLTSPTDIFVFGSNEIGRHGKGAALDAKLHYGAIEGQGEGLMGRSYGIPTKGNNMRVSLTIPEIKKYVDNFLLYVNRSDRKYTFYVTSIGCGLANYTPAQIAPLFFNSLFGNTPRVIYPIEWKEYANRGRHTFIDWQTGDIHVKL